MKKQFFRVKQLADQTFSRAGKTEVLSDDLQDAERRVEFIRSVCLNAGKKLANPNAGSHDVSAREKRLKKNGEYCLGVSMLESASSEDDHLLRQVVTDCGKLQMCLANAIVDHEMKVESNVVGPLLGVAESDYPNIVKLKRNLSKLILDMDSARTRYQTATKHGGGTGGGSKADLIKDELEEAELKVEQCRDGLACEMLQLISRETELASIILEYARLQRNYHVTAVAILDEIIPEMEAAIGENYMRPVFGKPLEEHLRVTGRKIAYPIELCVCTLLELGIGEEGLFRVAPGASKLRRVKLSLDAHCLDLEAALQFRDPHVFAGTLKSYLRELPEPLLTHALYENWMTAARTMSTSQQEGLNGMWTVLHSLPQANFDNLHYLVKFLATLASNKHANKMTPQNIAIVIAPNLIWRPNETEDIGHNMNSANLHSIIVDTLVSFSDWFFPGEIEFYQTFSKDISFLNGHNLSESQIVSQDPSGAGPAADMRRTQSNDSLSDHNTSPPHGSPKPAARSRKHHKSAAPTPPIHQHKEKEKEREKEEKTATSVNNSASAATSNSTSDKAEDKRDKGGAALMGGVSKETQPPAGVGSMREAKESPGSRVPCGGGVPVIKERVVTKEGMVLTSPTKPVVPEERIGVIEAAGGAAAVAGARRTESKLQGREETPRRPDQRESSDAKSTNDEENRLIMEFGQIEKRSDERGGGELNRRTSKSGEDLRGWAGRGARGGGEEVVYCTLERRRPPRPAPRSLLLSGESLEKPAVPERPAGLSHRPLSFRQSRDLTTPTTSPTESDNKNVSLERTHMYSVDKQQVSIIQVNSDSNKVPTDKTTNNPPPSQERRERGDSWDKPEKPKKPDSLTLNHGHQRAASEGSIIDTGLSSGGSLGEVCKSRPPRPTPPPPPALSPKGESTDL